MQSVVDTVVPVFAIVAAGALLAARGVIHAPALSRLALSVSGPCFVYTMLAESEVPPAEGARLVGGAAWMSLSSLVIARLWMGRRGRVSRGTLLVVGFWNAGNLALSCSRLQWGEAGLQAAAIVFCTTLFLNSTVGIWIASGSSGAGDLLRSPLFYGAVLGLSVRLAGIPVPFSIAEPARMLGHTTIPLLLLTLGAELRQMRIDDARSSLVPVLLRMGMGPLLMIAYVTLLGVDGLARKVLLLNSVMPGAVITVAMARRYGTEPRLVASSIALGTTLASMAIPLVLWLLGS